MADQDTKDILTAIEKQGERTATSIDSLIRQTTDVIGSLSQLTTAIKYSMKGPTRNGVWPIATISSVLLGLGVVFTTMAKQQSYIGDMRNGHQSKIIDLMDGYQRERNVSLDILLQKEIEKEAQIVHEAFTRADDDSRKRHLEQQRQIEEIRGWFRTPKVKENGQFNGGLRAANGYAT